MARIAIDGTEIAYELLGKDGDPAVVLTPGGRYSMEVPGLLELARALVDGGRRVLIYDRPNCGLSDACFKGASESEMQADALIGLVKALELGPIAIAGGSGGSRVSLLAAARAPELCSKLAIWWISGGPIGLMQLAVHYCGEAATMATESGMAAVSTAPAWAENLSRSSRAKEAVLGMKPREFIAVMQRWAAAYAPSDISPVPGMTPSDFAGLTMPTLVFRSGESDISHTRRTSEWVHRLIPHSTFVDPPWDDDEWNNLSIGARRGTEKGVFVGWPKLAPQLLDFLGR